jgi:3-methyladenine DNA glycosylase/8-oxoguanine DNA glycosylase
MKLGGFQMEEEQQQHKLEKRMSYLFSLSPSLNHFNKNPEISKHHVELIFFLWVEEENKLLC